MQHSERSVVCCCALCVSTNCENGRGIKIHSKFTNLCFLFLLLHFRLSLSISLEQSQSCAAMTKTKKNKETQKQKFAMFWSYSSIVLWPRIYSFLRFCFFAFGPTCLFNRHCSCAYILSRYFKHSNILKIDSNNFVLFVMYAKSI